MRTMALNSGEKKKLYSEGYEEERRITKSSQKLLLANMDFISASYSTFISGIHTSFPEQLPSRTADDIKT